MRRLTLTLLLLAAPFAAGAQSKTKPDPMSESDRQFLKQQLQDAQRDVWQQFDGFKDKFKYELKDKLDGELKGKLGDLSDKLWKQDFAFQDLQRDLKFNLKNDFNFDFDFDFKHGFDFDFRFDQLKDALIDAGRDFSSKTWKSGASGLNSTPREPWAQGDQADSLYRSARETLNRGDYRRAARLFGDIGDKYPKSTYAPDALYWRAYALYRIGANEELREGLAALDMQKSKYPQASTVSSDTPVLAARIRGALANRGDGAAQRQIEREANGAGAPCDKEDQAVRIEALSALGQMDPAATTPLLKRVIARRDECSTSLRRRAVFLIGRRADESSTELLADVAKNDPDMGVRTDAIGFLARTPGDKGIPVLEELLKSTDEQVQRAAIQALAQSESARAKLGLRALVENASANERLRAEVLSSFDHDKVSSEDVAWLRTMYAKVESQRLKARALNAIGRVGGPENDQWMLTLAKKAEEPMELRGEAIRRVAMTAPIADVAKLYDGTGERALREQLLYALARRKEPEASDKLLDIVRTGTDPQLRRSAIAILTRKNDPRTIKALLEIIDK